MDFRPEPTNIKTAYNPFNNNNFSDIVFSLSTNNGRFQSDEFADELYKEGNFNVFKIGKYNEEKFCWNEANFLSIPLDGFKIDELIFGLEEEQLFVVPCYKLDVNFRKVFNENNLLIGRYINGEKFMEITELRKFNEQWNIDEKYNGKSKIVSIKILFEEFCIENKKDECVNDTINKLCDKKEINENILKKKKKKKVKKESFQDILKKMTQKKKSDEEIRVEHTKKLKKDLEEQKEGATFDKLKRF